MEEFKSTKDQPISNFQVNFNFSVLVFLRMSNSELTREEITKNMVGAYEETDTYELTELVMNRAIPILMMSGFIVRENMKFRINEGCPSLIELLSRTVAH